MTRVVRLVCAVVALVSGIAGADDWPRFRGPNGSGVSDSTGIPVEFGPAKSLLWKTAVPFGRSSPVIAGDRIFLTASDAAKLTVLCLDRANGRILWRRDIERPRTTPLFKYNDSASPSPVTDGKNVYAFFLDLGLVSFSADGAERWRLPLGPFNTFYGLGASPILFGDTVLLLCDTRTDAFLVAVDRASGRIRWRVERTDTRLEGYSSPVIHAPEGQPAQVIVVGTSRVDGYAVATGERLWWARGLGSLPVASPILGKGMVYFSTYGADTPPGPAFDDWLKSDTNGDGRLSREEIPKFDEFGGVDTNNDGFLDRTEWDLLRNAAAGAYGQVAVSVDGRGDMSKTGVAWRDKKNYPFVPTALIYKDVLYLVKGGGIIASMDAATGEVFKVGRSKEALGEYYASPVAADDKVIFTSEAGKVTMLKAGRQWEILAVNDLGEECYATPAIVAGQIFIRTRNALYGFGKK